MKRLEPVLKDPLTRISLKTAVIRSIEDADDVYACDFSEDRFSADPGGKLEFYGCRFSHVVFSASKNTTLEFSNCVFDGCEFDGIQLSKGTFFRCAFENCRFCGTSFNEFTILNTLFSHCQLLYATFIDGKCENTEFVECAAEKIAFNFVSFKSVVFGETKMPMCEFLGIQLKGMDLTTCDISGIRIKPDEMKGAKITTVQAIDLIRLLGVIIKD